MSRKSLVELAREKLEKEKELAEKSKREAEERARKALRRTERKAKEKVEESRIVKQVEVDESREDEDQKKYQEELERLAKLPKPDVTVDAMRGLYWLVTRNSTKYKHMKKEELKKELDDILGSKDGMKRLLKALQDLIFS